jgi:hypothetical protein
MQAAQWGRCRRFPMRGVRIWLVTIIWLHLFQGHNFAAELSSASAAFRSLRTDLLNGRIVRVNILFMPYGERPHSPVKLDMLENYACPKIGVELSPRLKLVKELANSIDHTELSEPESRSDLRWGAIFFDKSESPIHSIHLNGPFALRTGTVGYVDGIFAGVNGFLISWLEGNFLSRAACER